MKEKRKGAAVENFPYRFIFPAEYTGEISVEDGFLWMRVDPPTIDYKKKLLSLTAHSHAEYELFVIEGGVLTLDTPTGPMRFSAGELALVPPHLLHTISLSDEAAVYGSCHFRFSRPPGGRAPRGVWHRLERMLPTGGVLRSIPPPGTAGRLALALEEGGLHPLLALFELLLSLSEREAQKEPEREETRREADLLYELNEVIGGRFMEPLTAAEVAALLFVSERKLSRLVHRHYGRSFHQILREKRIQTAESLLRTTDLTVEEIAGTVGYSSKVSLHTEFKKRYGMTPARYRREIKKQP